MTELAWGISEMAIIGSSRIVGIAERRANGFGRAIATLGFLLSKRKSRSSKWRAVVGGAPVLSVVPVATTEPGAAVARSEQAGGAPVPGHGITIDGGDER